MATWKPSSNLKDLFETTEKPVRDNRLNSNERCILLSDVEMMFLSWSTTGGPLWLKTDFMAKTEFFNFPSSLEP